MKRNRVLVWTRSETFLAASFALLRCFGCCRSFAELWPTEACLPAGQGGGKIPKDISDERERRRAHDAGFEDLTKRSITRGTSYTTGHLTAIGSTGRVLCMIINGVVAGAP